MKLDTKTVLIAAGVAGLGYYLWTQFSGPSITLVANGATVGTITTGQAGTSVVGASFSYGGNLYTLGAGPSGQLIATAA